MTRVRTLVSLAISLVPLAAFAADDFPRLGGALMGSPQEYWEPAYRKEIAKLDIAILATNPSWGSGHQTSTIEVTKQIKALNPKTRLFLYVIPESMRNPQPAPWAELESKVDQEKWWLYTKSSGGDLVLSDFGNDTYVLNITSYAPADAKGQRFNQWFGQYAANQFMTPNALVDGLYTDNVFWKPRRDGDWNRDGKIDSAGDPAVQQWYRQGYRQYFEAVKKNAPGKLHIGNVADWGKPESVLTEYDQQLNGGIFEGAIGKGYSVENRGWDPLLKSYRKIMAAMAPPKLLMFNQSGDPKDYQNMRYGLTTCLLDDGYYTFNDIAKGYYGVSWFDEYDAKLGKSMSTPPTKAWQSGVYRRDFENGIALVNPKGNGSRTVTLEGEFYKIKGKQDTSVNDGKLVTKVTLKDRDGIILLRTAPVRRPAAPNSLTIEAGG